MWPGSVYGVQCSSGCSPAAWLHVDACIKIYSRGCNRRHLPGMEPVFGRRGFHGLDLAAPVDFAVHLKGNPPEAGRQMGLIHSVMEEKSY